MRRVIKCLKKIVGFAATASHFKILRSVFINLYIDIICHIFSAAGIFLPLKLVHTSFEDDLRKFKISSLKLLS